MKRLKYFALAALVAFAACDEGDEVVTPDPVTGTITGVVTIDGAGAQGVTVTLSSGATATTGANGSYQLANVAEGAYTVTISGMPSDAAFGTTSKAAVISTAGQVVTVDFSGSFIITSAISVSVGGPQTGALSGTSVSIAGPASASQTTGVSGTVNFNGLRAGTYTVNATLSAGNAALYDLDAASKQVTVGLDELASVSFVATPKTISTISGRLFIDEAVKNNLFDANAEANVTVANIGIIIEGVSVGVFDTIQTAADGTFSLSGLPAANYRVAVDLTDAQIPGALAYGAADGASRVFTLGVADTEVVEFPFDIATQKIRVGAFLGTDGAGNARTTAIPGVGIRIYPTQALAVAAAGGFIASGTTNSTGEVTLSFARSADSQPLNSNPDNIVFARVSTPPAGPTFTANGETVIEIAYPATDSLKVADDEFDYLQTNVFLNVDLMELDNDKLVNWNVRLDTDTTNAGAEDTDQTNASGRARFPVTAVGTYFVRAQVTQPNANGHGFTVANTTQNGSTAVGTNGRWFRFTYDGTALLNAELDIGDAVVTYTDFDIRGRIHHETNDVGTVPTWQSATETSFGQVELQSVQLQRLNGANWVNVGAPVNPTVGTGAFSFLNAPVGPQLRMIATSNSINRAVLNDTIIMVTDGTDGSDQSVDQCDLRASGSSYATCSTFAYKLQDNTINGTVFYRDGSPAPNGTQVIIASADSTIQGRVIGNQAVDTVAVAGGAGAFTTGTTVREGFYSVTPVTNGTTIAFYASTNGGKKDVHVEGGAVVVPVPTATPARSASAPTATSAAASFHGFRENTSISGVIVNDRDQDGNTIDTDESLIGAFVTLYRDDVGAFSQNNDSIAATAVTGANGSYSFTGLRQGTYRVTVSAAGTETVQPTNLTLTTEAPAGAGSRTIGSTSPSPLPFWNYNTSTVTNPRIEAPGAPTGSQFTFLFNDGTISGNVSSGGANVNGVTVTLVQCATEATVFVVPTAGTCDTTVGGSFQNFVTGADGNYSFTGKREGIYQVTVVPASAGFTGTAAPGATILVFLDGRGDLEVHNYVLTP